MWIWIREVPQTQCHTPKYDLTLWLFLLVIVHGLQLRGRFLSVITAAGGPMVGTPIVWFYQRHNLAFTFRMLLKWQSAWKRWSCQEWNLHPYVTTNSGHFLWTHPLWKYQSDHLIRSTVSLISCICHIPCPKILAVQIFGYFTSKRKDMLEKKKFGGRNGYMMSLWKLTTT